MSSDTDDDYFEDYEDSDSEILFEDQSDSAQSFETLTVEEVVELMNKYIEEVNSIVQMPPIITRILLNHTKWEKQELLDRLTADDRDEFFKKAKVTDPFAEVSTDDEKQLQQDETMCMICFSDSTDQDMIGLSCCHKYCKLCWTQYLTLKIVDEGVVDSIRCPDTDCDIIVDDSTVTQLVSSETKQKYQHLITNSFVQYHYRLRWCPAPACLFAIKDNKISSYHSNCACKCGHEFCFKCGDSIHDPIPCSLIKDWKRNANDETISYIVKFSKECPKCATFIEKNGGCNRMICTKCKHPFCWFCLGPMVTYNHDCNTYKLENDAVKMSKKALQMKRWRHYYERYDAHKKSLEVAKSSVNGFFADQIDEIESVTSNMHKVQFIKATDVLIESRKKLILTYIFAYYVEEHNQKTIFEENQRDLENATELLSQYLESHIKTESINELMNTINDKSDYCKRRHQIMQDHICEGFDNSWWSFILGDVPV